jgi:hypothetical protein
VLSSGPSAQTADGRGKSAVVPDVAGKVMARPEGGKEVPAPDKGAV